MFSENTQRKLLQCLALITGNASIATHLVVILARVEAGQGSATRGV